MRVGCLLVGVLLVGVAVLVTAYLLWACLPAPGCMVGEAFTIWLTMALLPLVGGVLLLASGQRRR